MTVYLMEVGTVGRLYVNKVYFSGSLDLFSVE